MCRDSLYCINCSKCFKGAQVDVRRQLFLKKKKTLEKSVSAVVSLLDILALSWALQQASRTGLLYAK